MSIPVENIAIFLQKFTVSAPSIPSFVSLYASVGVVTTNNPGNRQWQFTWNGVFSSTESFEIMYDFSHVNTYGYSITFEGNLNGFLTLDGKNYASDNYMTYIPQTAQDILDKIVRLRFKPPCPRQPLRERSLYYVLNLNDASSKNNVISLTYGIPMSLQDVYGYSVQGTSHNTLTVLASNNGFEWSTINTGDVVYTVFDSGVSNTILNDNTGPSLVEYIGPLTDSSGGSVPLIYVPLFTNTTNWAFYHDYSNNTSPPLGGQCYLSSTAQNATVSVLQLSGNRFQYSVSSASAPILYLVVDNISTGSSLTITQIGNPSSFDCVVYVYDMSGSYLSTTQTPCVLSTTVYYTGNGWSTSCPSVEMINVVDYGCVGDGVTDNTTILQNLLDTYTGYILFFPPGIYAVYDSLLIGSNTRLQGSGTPPWDDNGVEDLWIRILVDSKRLTLFGQYDHRNESLFPKYPY
jgi:Pectate lyase superfamily protein